MKSSRTRIRSRRLEKSCVIFKFCRHSWPSSQYLMCKKCRRAFRKDPQDFEERFQNLKQSILASTLTAVATNIARTVTITMFLRRWHPKPHWKWRVKISESMPGLWCLVKCSIYTYWQMSVMQDPEGWPDKQGATEEYLWCYGCAISLRMSKVIIWSQWTGTRKCRQVWCTPVLICHHLWSFPHEKMFINATPYSPKSSKNSDECSCGRRSCFDCFNCFKFKKIHQSLHYTIYYAPTSSPT